MRDFPILYLTCLADDVILSGLTFIFIFDCKGLACEIFVLIVHTRIQKIVRGGPTLTTVFLVYEGGSKCQYKQAIIGPTLNSGFVVV